jgi:hypothetical protein
MNGLQQFLNKPPNSQQKQVDKDESQLKNLVKKYRQFTTLKNTKEGTVDNKSKLKELFKSQTIGQIHSLINNLSDQRQFLEVANLLEILSDIQIDSKYSGEADSQKINFKIDQKIGVELINAGFTTSVIENFDLFQGLEPNLLVESVLNPNISNQDELINLLFKDLYMFPRKSISLENMHKLVDLGFQEQIVNKNSKFETLDNYLAEALVKADQTEFILNDLYNFANLSTVVAQAFLNHNFVDNFSRNLDKFQILDLKTLKLYFQKIKETSARIYPHEISEIFKAMSENGVSQKELLELISTSLETEDFTSFLFQLKNLNSDAADIISEKLGLDYILSNLENFISISEDALEKILLELLKKSGDAHQSGDINKIMTIRDLGLSDEKITQILLENSSLELMIKCGDIFKKVDFEDIIQNSLTENQDSVFIIYNNIEAILKLGLEPKFLFEKILDKFSTSKKLDKTYCKLLISIIKFIKDSNQNLVFSNQENQAKFEQVNNLVGILSNVDHGDNSAFDDFSSILVEHILGNKITLENVTQFLASKGYLEQPRVLENLVTFKKLDISNSDDITKLDELYNLQNGMKMPCASADIFIKKFGRGFVIKNANRFESIDELVSLLLKTKPEFDLEKDPFPVTLLNKAISGSSEYKTVEHFLQSNIYIEHSIEMEETVISGKLDLGHLENLKLLDRLGELNRFKAVEIVETGVFTLENRIIEDIVTKLEDFSKMPLKYGDSTIPENTDTREIATQIVCKKLNSISLIINFSNGLESKLAENLITLTDEILPSLFIKSSGFTPTPYLAKSLLSPEKAEEQIQEWQEVLNSFENGLFDSGNEFHKNLEYTRFRRIVDNPKISGYIKSSMGFDEYLGIFNSKNEVEIFNEQDSFEIECLLEEVKKLMDLIVDLKTQADKLGQELWVIPNLSYGYLPVSIIQNELDKIGVKTIHGLKVGSSESHDDKEVFNNTLLSNIAEDIYTKNPLIVVVDGTKNIEKNIANPKYPDSYQGYLNQLIALNDALGFPDEDYEYAGKTASDLINLRAKPDFQDLVIYFKNQTKSQKQSTKPYTFNFWNSGGLDLNIKGESFNPQVPKQLELNNLNSCAMIFCNIGLLDDQISQGIKDKYPYYLAHTPAYFDDSEKIVNLSFFHDEYGIIFTNALEHQAREKYYEDQAINERRIFCCIVDYLINLHKKEVSKNQSLAYQTTYS